MKQKIIIAVMLSWMMALTWCSLVPQIDNRQDETSNPASSFCEENWWTLEIIPDEWWSWWKCNFDDGSFCEERAFYHGECSPGRWNWNTIELEEIQELQNGEDLSQETKDEISELVDEIKEGEVVDDSWKNEEITVQDLLDNYEATWSELSEEDIDLMKDVIDVLVQ